MRKTIALLLALQALPAAAEELRLSEAEIRAALSDKIVAGTDDSGKPYTQIFQKGGLTIYSVGPQASSNGFWDVRGDQYCSQWPPNESWSCYDMTGEGTGLTFIAASGKRYRVTVQP